MSDATAVVAPHVAVGVSDCLHVEAAVCHRLGVERTRKAADEHGMCHVPNVHQPKVPLLVADVLHPLVLFREILQINVLEALVVHRLSHFLEKVMTSV